MTTALPGGTVHKAVPDKLGRLLMQHAAARTTWNEITPLARNEWICLVTSAKQEQTTERRLKRAIDQLSRGQKRPCCWEGCPHRTKNGR